MMARQRPAIKSVLGVDLFPGSLNVCLTRSILLNGSRSHVHSEIRMLWPGTVNGVPVWLYRWPSAPLHVVELVAEENLRDRLGVLNGSTVTIRLDAELASVPSIRSRVVSNALWSGRRDWYYTNDNYTKWAGRLEKRLGGIQGRPPQAAPEVS